VFVDQQGLFLRHGQGVETGGLGEGGVDQCLVHAVVADEIEADVLAGPAQFFGQTAVGALFAGAMGAEVEDGDGVVHTLLSLLRAWVGEI
jgi:hypothetical protein